MKRILSLPQILVVALAASWVVSCGSGGDPHKASREAKARQMAEERAALKVGVMPTLDCLPIYLLHDSLLYDTAKADIRLRRFTAHMDIDTALAGGSVQVGVSDMVRAAFLGRRGTYLKSLTGTNAYWSLLTVKDLQIDSLAKLADKTIAMTRHSATDLLTEDVRKRAKLKAPAYAVQINDVALRLKMLSNAQIETAWLSEPQLTQAKLAGARVLVDGSKDSLRMGVLVYHESPDDDFALRAQQLDEFQNAYRRACRAISENGLAHYAPLLKKYMGLDAKAIAALPKVLFDGITTPKAADIKRAKSFR